MHSGLQCKMLNQIVITDFAGTSSVWRVAGCFNFPPLLHHRHLSAPSFKDRWSPTVLTPPRTITKPPEKSNKNPWSLERQQSLCKRRRSGWMMDESCGWGLDVSGQLDFTGTWRVTEFICPSSSAIQPITVELSQTWRSMVCEICAKRLAKLALNGN